MSKYEPPFHINNRMLTLVADISEKLGQMQYCGNLERRPHLRKNNRIRSIHSSLKIEANSLSLSEVRDAIDGHVVLGEQREIREVLNAYAAYEMIADIDPFSLAQLKKVHAVMMQYILEEPGAFRRGDEGVFQGDQCIFMAPPARLVPELMSDLFSWMRRAASKETVHPLILASVFHYEFVFIHPFADGNGRMARLWHTVLLSKWQPIFAYLPLESQIEKFQDGYYRAIADSHTRGDSDVFIEFMLERIDAVLDEVAGQLQIAEPDTSERVKKLLAVMEPGMPYTAAALMDMLGLKSRDTFRNHYLHPAMEQGLVEMTIPDKPQSRNQRYVRQSP